MMTKEIDDGAEFWLPSDFLSDDFFTAEEKRAENEGDEETLQLMNHSFHGESKNPKPSVMATSPQSTLCGIGRWSFNSNGSPDGNSLVSSPPSTPFQKQRDDALDLLYAAAGQVERLSLNNNNGRSSSVPIKNHHQRMNLLSNQDLIQQQLQAARFYQLKRQQLLKLQQQQQQLNAAWGRQQQVSRASNAGKAASFALSCSAWPPLQKQSPQQAPQRGAGMTAVFLNGGRRQSSGTGVFLPRRSGTPAEPRKKPACSTVLLPARVVQALNLNVEDMEVHPRAPNCYVVDSDVMMGRSNMKRNQAAAAAAVGASPELRLPQEWTY